MAKFTNKPTWTLREVMKAIKAIEVGTHGDDIGPSYPALDNFESGERVFLPQLRRETSTVYSGLQSYKKRVDNFISKHGPDAEFIAGRYDLETEPIKEINDGNLTEPSKEASQSTNPIRCGNPEVDHSGTEAKASMTVLVDGDGLVHGEAGKDDCEAVPVCIDWDISLGGDNPGARHKAELPSPLLTEPNGPSASSRDDVVSPPFSDDKAGISTLPDSLVPVSMGSANPCDRAGSEKSQDNDDNNRLDYRSSGPSSLRGKHSDSLGDVSSPLNTPFSFGTFALSGAKGRMSWGLSKPTTKVSLKDLIGSTALSHSLDESWLQTDTSGFSRESKFRSGSPGGYVDEHKAELEKKFVKRQARKIARHFDGFFRDNEVGIGVEQTPRISGKKLVKELIGKAIRLSRTKKEEKGTGLKLVLVDISPSCGEIRDACFAAGLAIAEQDPNVVVVAHFNGYMSTRSSHIIGYRQKEVPRIKYEGDLDKFEAFLASGKVSGAVCFGDDDATTVYALLSRYCPTLWMSPDDEDYCTGVIKELNKKHKRAYAEARMYIIGGVHDARSAVSGLKKLREKK